MKGEKNIQILFIILLTFGIDLFIFDFFIITFLVCYYYYVDIIYLYVNPFLKYHEYLYLRSLRKPCM
jgi:hypothetical protein